MARFGSISNRQVKFATERQQERVFKMPARVLFSILMVNFTMWVLGGFDPLAADDDFSTGLAARYRTNRATVERAESAASFDWNRDAPDPRLSRGPFQAEWLGLLLFQNEGRYTFHAFLQGKVDIEIDGQTILRGERKQAGWLSGPEIPLSFGEKEIVIRFEKIAEEARLHVFWSSDHFSLEPLPEHLMFHEDPNIHTTRVERGRIQTDAHRCNRCHRRDDEPLSPPAPALTHFSQGTNPEWIKRKLLGKPDSSIRPAGTEQEDDRIGEPFSHDRMPTFDFTDEEADAIAQFLLKNSREVELKQLPPSKDVDQDRAQGELLVRSLGCLACHTVENLGQAPPHSGGRLTEIARKRSADWLFTWLGEPAALNADHQMPQFPLTNDEQRQLALYLSHLGNDANAINASDEAPGTDRFSADSVEFVDRRVDQGRRLVEAARCTACHQIPGLESLPGLLPKSLETFSKDEFRENRSCLSAQADRQSKRPAYPHIDREAMVAFLSVHSGALSPASEFARGEQVLERRNCLQCHDRGTNKGLSSIVGSVLQIDERLRNEGPTLTPPSLTAIGDKLRDAALAEAISGEQKHVRLPWLRIRMPKFQHSDQDKQALLSYLIARDRIPEDGPNPQPAPLSENSDTNSRPGSSEESTRDPEALRGESDQLVDGHTLIGSRGFSCIACHAIGSYTPRNVALGTRGSDLFQLGKRMRPEFFFRWTRSPMRIVPGMEMPSYMKPVPGILDSQIDRQLTAVWSALNDERLTPPTDPSVVEQFLIVRSNEPARVVRDVFTNPPENGGGAVARALAIGLNNGHNFLYDLETFTLRQWAFGDFARQRTVGKSWYWDLAGLPIVSGFDRDADLFLQKRSDSRGSTPPIGPHEEFGLSGHLESYEADGMGVRIRYQLLFDLEGTEHRLTVTETVMPLQRESADLPASVSAETGWSRRFEFESIPGGYDVLIARPRVTPNTGKPRIEPGDAASGEWETLRVAGDDSEASASRHFLRVSQSDSVKNGSASRSARLNYLGELSIPELELKPKSVQQNSADVVDVAPGFDGVRLPLSASIMPTALTWTSEGTLAFTSLKGDVFLVRDENGDSVEEALELFEEGLAAPFGILSDENGLLVVHKPEVLRLQDTTGDGRADRRTVIATGWGYTDDYHDWTCGLIRDSLGNLYVGTGSDYAQKNRPAKHSRWRGKVLKIDPQGAVSPVGHAFRYPTGLAITTDDRIFISDQQGVQNTFNEINSLIPGRHYGVPSLTEEHPDASETPAAVKIPYPWTRSVNGLCILPDDFPISGLAGHGIGAEYEGRFLIRFTYQQVGETVQGATYPLTKPNPSNTSSSLLGPICCAVGPNGDLYVGSIHDSGWLGGRNTGDIVRFTPNGQHPNGIRELRARRDGFEVEFFQPIDRMEAVRVENYSISGYTRVWKGGYGTPESGRYKVDVLSADVSDDLRTVRLRVDPASLREQYVYDLNCGKIGGADVELWPDTAHYTMNHIPE